MYSMVRLGILSTASIVGRFVAASRECNNAQVIAIASRDYDRAKAFADTAGIERVHESYESLIRDPNVDAVYIPLVNSLHHHYAMRALEAGKHVLVEKPMCLRPEDNVLASCRISSHVVMENRLVIWCDKGSVEIPEYWKARTAFVRYADGREEVIDYPCEHEIRYELEHYCSCIEKGLVESPVTSAQRTVRYLAVTSSIRSQMGLPEYPA